MTRYYHGTKIPRLIIEQQGLRTHLTSSTILELLILPFTAGEPRTMAQERLKRYLTRKWPSAGVSLTPDYAYAESYANTGSELFSEIIMSLPRELGEPILRAYVGTSSPGRVLTIDLPTSWPIVDPYADEVLSPIDIPPQYITHITEIPPGDLSYPNEEEYLEMFYGP